MSCRRGEVVLLSGWAGAVQQRSAAPPPLVQQINAAPCRGLRRELQNEPRLDQNYEQRLGIQPGSIICDWVGELARLIK